MSTEQTVALSPTRVRPGLAAFWRAGLLVLGYALPALLLYAPALGSFGTTIPGGPTAERDGWQNVWNLWWAAQAVGRGTNPLHTTWLYYPEGIGLFWQTLNVTNGLLALPVTLLAGPVAAYNLLALLAFVLSGVTMYALARDLGIGRAAAFVAGLLYSFAPLHVARFVDGQLEHMTIQWLPLFALLLRRAFQRLSWRASIGAGLLLLWITLTSLYQALSCLLLVGLLAAATYLLGQRSWGRARALALRAGLMLGIWLLPLAPLLLGAATGGGPDRDWLDSQRLHSATPLDFVLPNPNHPLWGAGVTRFGQALHPDAGSWNVALGTLTVALALWWLLRRSAWREPWPWVGVACLVLALGPSLVLGGYDTGIPLPYALLNLFPPARLGQRPNYLALLALLALVLVAARAIQHLLARATRPSLLLGGLLVLLAIDLAPAPPPPLAAAVPEVFAQLAADPTPGAVLELPFLPERSEPLRAQLVHGRPIMGGYVSRTPDYRFPVERPALQALWTRRVPDELVSPDWAASMGSTLAHYNIRYVVVRWRELPPAERAELSTLFASLRQGLLQQVYDFQGLGVYRLENPGELVPFVFQRGAYPVERTDGRAWQWMGATAQLVVVNPAAEQRGLVFDLRAEAPGGARPLGIELERPGGATLPLTSIELTPDPAERRLHLVLPPGETTLRLTTQTDQVPGDARQLGAAFTRLAVRYAGAAP
jgi:hypothetical protein